MLIGGGTRQNYSPMEVKRMGLNSSSVTFSYITFESQSSLMKQDNFSK